MSNADHPATGTDAFALPSDLGIEAIADLSDLLAARIRSDVPVIIDGRAVSRVHTAALQLLCMFCVGRRKAGRATQWLEPSESLRQAVALLSLNPLLQLAEAA